MGSVHIQIQKRKTPLIKIIDSIEPIEENLIGTNGIKYRHIYVLIPLNQKKVF